MLHLLKVRLGVVRGWFGENLCCELCRRAAEIKIAYYDAIREAYCKYSSVLRFVLMRGKCRFQQKPV